MPKNPPENMPRVTPYLYYEDVDAAIEWLTRAFGFVEGMRMTGADGKATHADMAVSDSIIMMGHPGPGYKNPKRLGHVTQAIYVYVDGVDQHFERAKAAGAKVLQEPKDQFYGDRTYGVEDPEGHHWYFAEHFRDVAPEDMHPR